MATLTQASGSQSLIVGPSQIEFNDVQGEVTKSIQVFYYKPSNYSAQSPILFVMHGIQRNAQDYRDQWVAYADQYGFLLVAPEFSEENFPDNSYANGELLGVNLGDMPKRGSGFELIEHLFDEVVQRSGNVNSSYYLYGHSAGAQFVHRMLLLSPQARIKRAVAANAGFYTLPRFVEIFPYGLQQSGLTEAGANVAFTKDLTIFLGEADTLENQRNLNRSPGAMLQGKHRFARGMTFYKVAKDESTRNGVELAWKLKTVPGAGHSNIKMASAAAHALFTSSQN